MFFRDGIRRIDFVLAYVDDKDVEKRQVREKCHAFACYHRDATTMAAQAVFTKFCFPVEFVVSLDTKAFFFFFFKPQPQH